MDREIAEKRSSDDRRQERGRPGFRYLLMGRRKRPRRVEEQQPNFYAEVYGLRIFFAALLLVFLSMMDATFTLFHVGRGAQEINPGMNLLLQLGETEFFYVKYSITCIGVLFLSIHKNFLYVKKILLFLILIYILVISWHLYLLRSY